MWWRSPKTASRRSACLEHETFDVILDGRADACDGDGLDATQKNPPPGTSVGVQYIPIIALTAHALKRDRERCLEAGMDGYLAKPVRAKDMYETIEAVLAQLATGTPAAGG